MSDLQRYIETRSARDQEFARGFQDGYAEFKIGVLLRQAREAAGLSREEMALRLQRPKSAISKIENHAETVSLSLLQRYAETLGKNLYVNLA